MKKGTFIVYDVDLQSIRFITEEQAGKLFKALAAYRLNSEAPDFGDDTALKILFHQFSEHIAINEEKYKETCRKNAESAKKRWENKNITSVPTLTQACEGMRTHTNGCLYDTDTETDNGNGNDTVTVDVTETDNSNTAEEHTKTYYGIYKNVPLTKQEYLQLINKFGSGTDTLIDSMSEYMRTSGKTYKDCYARLLTWKLYDDKEKTHNKTIPRLLQDEPSYDIDAFTKKSIGIKYTPPTKKEHIT